MPSSFQPKGKHCIVTGGNQGLGRSVGLELAKLGAHVTIVARNEDLLRSTTAELEEMRLEENQRFEWVSADLTNKEKAIEAIRTSEERHGSIPDYVFLCAGASFPGMFVEQDADELASNMSIVYHTALYTSHAAIRRMVEGGKPKGCKIIFVASVLSFMGIVGYSGYCASKYALRGLADVLRNEMLMYGIDIHIYFPGNMLTKGYERENLTKPDITKRIEGADEGITADVAAKALIQGVNRGHYQITSDPIGMLLRSSVGGVVPSHWPILDFALGVIGTLILSPWRLVIDYMSRKEGQRQEQAAEITRKLSQ
ncbi:oxidoreductase [Piptocephalis cylindrospora]|uniref:3-dehydrosphinganine reductase n=1 Tax=Piptocephalis cylindrospora TaxID=1907219 RepID=A0A4P9Y6E0_9FUNG|nr:oxidoreductase [Piptocephalis cylindrospora]|eukprot:RKP14342.1 oxidoreductase [Piptocephalis cylindrospora]